MLQLGKDRALGNELAEFFGSLYEDREGKAVIARLNDNFEPVNQKFFTWPEQADALYAYVEKHADENIYFCPTLFKAPRARKVVAKSCAVVYGDADTFDLDNLHLPPSIIVRTSPGHTHVYWMLEDTTDPMLAERLAHGVSVAHPKAETGFDDGWAINKLLRVPGTTNTKYGTSTEVTAEYTGAIYTVEEFEQAYPPAETVQVEHREMGHVPSYAEALNSIPSSSQLTNLLNKHYDKGSSGSQALYLLENELFRLGATDEAAFAIIRKSPLNKWERDGHRNHEELLWADILRARAKEYRTEAEDEEADDAVITIQPSAKPKEIDFLSDEEKEHLGTSFIDEYLAWASSKTDAATEYHVAAAFTILSVVFSDFGHATPKFGRLPLNLWFMVLGETTRSRKSTTKSQMLKVVNALQDEEVYQYNLGSDFTSEGLSSALAERSNRSALVHKDEIQSFVKEADSKSYMAGIKGSITELYDGNVSGKLRATGDNRKQPPSNVAFCFFAMGIRDQLAEYLTQEDFQSGFLTRFIYVEADAPERSAASDYLAQSDLNEAKVGDHVFDKMVRDLDEARDHWASFVAPDGPTTAVPATDEAWQRLNKFITDVLDAAEGNERHAIIEASAHRLTISILKAATLLAMSECCDDVELRHMLTAINYCGTWFMHMVSMANRVSASSWKRRLDKLEAYLISRGGEATWEATYNHFKSDIRPREFLEIVNALEDAGMAVVHTVDKKRYITATEVA